MNPREHDIRTALEATLSGVQRDPTLFDRIISDQKGAPAPMKRKLTLSMALVLALVLITGTVACSAAWRGVSAFLSNPDPDYLVTGFPQHHTSDRLDARVVDAYWDGLEFFVACRIAPAAANGGSKKFYRLTKKGQQVLRELIAFWNNYKTCVDEFIASCPLEEDAQ